MSFKLVDEKSAQRLSSGNFHDAVIVVVKLSTRTDEMIFRSYVEFSSCPKHSALTRLKFNTDKTVNLGGLNVRAHEVVYIHHNVSEETLYESIEDRHYLDVWHWNAFEHGSGATIIVYGCAELNNSRRMCVTLTAENKKSQKEA